MMPWLTGVFIIEASKTAPSIVKGYYIEGHRTKYLRLTGQFYLDEGVPLGYEQMTGETPRKARVFRYDKVEYIDK